MRWLKFRVWYIRYPQPIKGEMRYFNQSNDGFPIACKSYQPDNWMQFIGLKDSKGKDVYEGDIVLVTPHAGVDKSPYYGLIEWDAPCFQIKAPKVNYPFGGGFIPFSHSLGFFNGIEVVGNKYENPELLDDIE